MEKYIAIRADVLKNLLKMGNVYITISKVLYIQYYHNLLYVEKRLEINILTH